MYRFIKDSSFFNRGTGGSELKFIDPNSLSVVAEATLVDRCSCARMALVAANRTDIAEDVIILLGDEFVLQYRW